MRKQIRRLGVLLCAFLVAGSSITGFSAPRHKQGNSKRRVAIALEALRAAENRGADVQSALNAFTARVSADGEKAIPHLIEALSDQGEGAWIARYGAILALARIGQPAVPALSARLRSSDLRAALGAADALSLISGGNVLDAANNILTNGSLLEKKRAIYVLGHMEPADREDQISQIVDRRISALVTLLRDERLHSEAELALIRMSQVNAFNIQDRVIDKLLDVLKQAYYNDPPSVMAGFGASRILGAIGEPALPALKALVADEGSCSPYSDQAFNDGSLGDGCACGCCAVYATAYAGEPGIAALVENITNFSPDLRSRNLRGMSMQALSDIGAAAANPVIEMLEKRNNTSNPKLATKVGVTILGSIAAANSEAVLAAYYNQETDRSLKSLSHWALDKTRARNNLSALSTGSSAGDEVSPRSVSELFESLREAENRVDDTALPFTTLVNKARSEGPKAFPELFKVLADTHERHWVVRMAAISSFVAIGDPSITALAQRLGDYNPKISFSVADALSQIGGPKVVEAAAQKLTNGDFNFFEKQRAIYVLGRIADAKSISVLTSALRNEMLEYEAAEALRQIGKPAIPALAGAVRASRYSDSRSMESAFVAARVLSSLGKPGLDALASIVHNSNGTDGSCQIAATYGWSYNGQKQIASLLKRSPVVAGGR